MDKTILPFKLIHIPKLLTIVLLTLCSNLKADVSVGIGQPELLFGVITEIRVLVPGSGYTVRPDVLIIDTNGGTGASASAQIENGEVVSVNILNGGTGYSSSTTVFFIPASDDVTDEYDQSQHLLTFNPYTVQWSSQSVPETALSGTEVGEISGFLGVKDIAAGYEHLMILMDDGSLWTVGSNQYGQLGDGTTTGWKLIPRKIVDSKVTSIAAGSRSSWYIMEDGSLWGFGATGKGLLNGNQDNSLFPAFAMDDVDSIFPNYEDVYVVKNDGSLLHSGTGGTTQGTYEWDTLLESGVRKVEGGYQHAFISMEDDSIFVVGRPTYGRFGNGWNDNWISTPREIPLIGAKSFAGGSIHSLMLKDDGSLWSTGAYPDGQLGNGLSGNSANTELWNYSQKEFKSILDSVSSIAAYASNSVVLMNDGTVRTFGTNIHGEAGVGLFPISPATQNEENHYYVSRPTDVGISDVKMVEAGRSISFAIKNDGSIWASGSNVYFLFGSGGSAENTNVFTEINRPESPSLTFLLSDNPEYPDNSLFLLDGNRLKNLTALDHDVKQSYSIELIVSDDRGNSFAEEYQIIVEDVAIPPSNISLDNTVIDENSKIGTVMANLTTEDADQSESHVYSLPLNQNYPDNSYFSISGNRIVTATSINFESKSSHTILVRSTDPTGEFYEKEFQITVTDIAESPKNLELSNPQLVIGSPSGRAIGKLLAEDDDPGNTISYSLGELSQYPDNALFQISGDTLSTKANLGSRETYTVQVIATDSTGLTSAKVLTINANPVGSVKWEFSAGASVVSSAAISTNGTIFIGDWNQNLYALDEENGDLLWEFHTSGSGSIISAPTVDSNNTVYAPTTNGSFYAINGRDGSIKWSFQTGDENTSATIGHGDLLYFGSDDNKLYALNKKDGSQVWTYSTGGDISSSPVLHSDGTVIFASWEDNHIYALNGTDGSLIWRYNTGEQITNSASIDLNGVAYIGSQQGNVYALNIADGSLVWKSNIGNAIGLGEGDVCPVLASNEQLLIGTGDGKLYSLNTADGAGSWVFQTSGIILSSVAVTSDGTVLVGTNEGRFYGVDRTTGLAKWTMIAEGSIESSPVVTQSGTIIFGSHVGKVYGLYGISPPADSPWPMLGQNSKRTSVRQGTPTGWVNFNDFPWIYSANTHSWYYLVTEGNSLHTFDKSSGNWNYLLNTRLPKTPAFLEGVSKAEEDVLADPQQFGLLNDSLVEASKNESYDDGFNSGEAFDDFAPESPAGLRIKFVYEIGLISEVSFSNDGLNGSYTSRNISGSVIYIYEKLTNNTASLTLNTAGEIIVGTLTFDSPTTGSLTGTSRDTSGNPIGTGSAAGKFWILN